MVHRGQGVNMDMGKRFKIHRGPMVRTGLNKARSQNGAMQPINRNWNISICYPRISPEDSSPSRLKYRGINY